MLIKHTVPGLLELGRELVKVTSGLVGFVLEIEVAAEESVLHGVKRLQEGKLCHPVVGGLHAIKIDNPVGGVAFVLRGDVQEVRVARVEDNMLDEG